MNDYDDDGGLTLAKCAVAAILVVAAVGLMFVAFWARVP